MPPDCTACVALAARYPNHTIVRGYGRNQQSCCFVVHRPTVIRAIDFVCGNTTIDFYLIRPVNDPGWLFVQENNTRPG